MRQAKPGTILIVDDNLTNLQVLFNTLKEANYHVVPAQGAGSAFTRLKHVVPDLILLDIMMPGVDGFELYRQLRESPSTRQTPVIFISALDDNQAIVRGFKLGAVDYITKPFRAEEVLARVSRQLEISRLQGELEEELEQRKRLEASLREAKERAETANQAKSAFLANMSHELRTPLNAVLGFAQILAQDQTLGEQRLSQIESIRRGGEYLLTLINDILDLAKIEAGRFELLPSVWDSASFFLEIARMFRIRAAQKGIDFHFAQVEAVPATLYCDDKRLRQIVMNLLGNAVKFTERGQVELRVGFADNILWLEARDSGIGIGASEIDKIFEPFQQAGTDRYKLQGTGLGLAISRRLVESMGGTLGVNSRLGEGSIFRVEIPVEAVSTLAEAQARSEQRAVVGYRRSRGDGALRILAVDDLVENRQVLRGLLEPLGFRVEEAENGRQCLDIAPQYRPDVVLMDLRMPVMGGLEAARILRERSPRLPIVVLSASAFAEDHSASLRAGCDAHLDKPVRLPELLETLGRLLPLQWNYLEPASPGEESRVEALPAEQAARFSRLIKSGDMSGMEKFAEQLCASCPVFAAKLGRLARNFDIGGILELEQTPKPKVDAGENSRGG